MLNVPLTRRSAEVQRFAAKVMGGAVMPEERVDATTLDHFPDGSDRQCGRRRFDRTTSACGDARTSGYRSCRPGRTGAVRRLCLPARLALQCVELRLAAQLPLATEPLLAATLLALSLQPAVPALAPAVSPLAMTP
jgi:hypothetical protein